MIPHADMLHRISQLVESLNALIVSDERRDFLTFPIGSECEHSWELYVMQRAGYESVPADAFRREYERIDHMTYLMRCADLSYKEAVQVWEAWNKWCEL